MPCQKLAKNVLPISQTNWCFTLSLVCKSNTQTPLPNLACTTSIKFWTKPKTGFNWTKRRWRWKTLEPNRMRLNTYCWASSRTLRYSLPIRKFHQRISREDYPKGYHCFAVGLSWTIQFWVQSFSNSRFFWKFLILSTNHRKLLPYVVCLFEVACHGPI